MSDPRGISPTRYSASAALHRHQSSSSSPASRASEIPDGLTRFVSVHSREILLLSTVINFQKRKISAFAKMEMPSDEFVYCFGTDTGSVYVCTLNGQYLLLPPICWTAGSVLRFAPSSNGTLAVAYESGVVAIWTLRQHPTLKILRCTSRAWKRLPGKPEITSLCWGCSGSSLLFIGDNRGSVRVLSSLSMNFHKRIVFQSPDKSEVNCIVVSQVVGHPVDGGITFCVGISCLNGHCVVLRIECSRVLVGEQKLAGTSDLLSISSQMVAMKPLRNHLQSRIQLVFSTNNELWILRSSSVFCFQVANRLLSKMLDVDQDVEESIVLSCLHYEGLEDCILWGRRMTNSCLLVNAVGCESLAFSQFEIPLDGNNGHLIVDSLRRTVTLVNVESPHFTEIRYTLRKLQRRNEMRLESKQSETPAGSVQPIKKRKGRSKMIEIKENTGNKGRVSLSPTRSFQETVKLPTEEKFVERMNQLCQDYNAWKRERGEQSLLALICLRCEELFAEMGGMNPDALRAYEGDTLSSLIQAGFVLRASKVSEGGEADVLEYFKSAHMWIGEVEFVLTICSKFKLIETFQLYLRKWKSNLDSEKEKIQGFLQNQQKATDYFTKYAISVSFDAKISQDCKQIADTGVYVVLVRSI
jgi:hypothetical protein